MLVLFLILNYIYNCKVPILLLLPGYNGCFLSVLQVVFLRSLSRVTHNNINYNYYFYHYYTKPINFVSFYLLFEAHETLVLSLILIFNLAINTKMR